ncbi:MAG: ribonuclease P protein component [Bacteroidales bacterium]|nr:ribonuclease P protein component [Bacteroidales bacterium]
MEDSFENSNYKYTLRKEERLCSKKIFDKLFSSGISILVYPVKVLYIITEHSGNYPAQAAFAVSKKIFRKAVDRSLLKRRMREAYRLNKHTIYDNTGDKKLIIIFIYIGREIINFQQIEKAFIKILHIISKNFSNTVMNS